MEPATGRRVNRVADLTLEDGGRPGSTRLGSGHGPKERFRIGVLGVAEYLFCLAHFHYFAQVHYGDMGRYMLERGQIMSNDHIGKVLSFLDIGQQIQILGADGYFQSRYRLIQND
jgi:hypothetical protein